MKYVSALNKAEIITLQYAAREHPLPWTRVRANSMIGQTACAICPIGSAVEFRFAPLSRLDSRRASRSAYQHVRADSARLISAGKPATISRARSSTADPIY